MVYSFEVSVKGTEWSRIINARSAGKAKADYHRDILDPWPDLPFTAIRCRKIGAPHTSKQFERNAAYRGLPDVKCGQRVKVGDEFGVIVGHNASANFDVLFDERSKYRGQTLNCHPDSCEMVNDQDKQ